MKIELSDRQVKTVGAAITIVSAFIILVAIGAILYLIGLFVSRFSNVFLPLAVAAVAAFVVRPYYELLTDRVRLPAVLALVAVFLSILLPLGAFGWFFGALVVEQITGLTETAPETWAKIEDYFRERWPNIVEFVETNHVGERLRSAVEGREASLVQGLRGGLDTAVTALSGVMRAVGSVLTWAVLPVYFAFFLMADPGKTVKIDTHLTFLKEDTRESVVYLVKEFVNILVAFFRGQLIIAFLQGALFAIGFSIVGLKYGLVLGLMLGFLNIIPYLGNMVGLGIAVPLSFFQDGGGTPLFIAIMVVFALVQTIEGYLLTPRIMGDRTGLHPMVIIIAIFFWGSALGGISGMILAIPLTAFLVVFWRLAQEKYIGELV